MRYGDFCKSFFYNLAVECMDDIVVEDKKTKYVITATVDAYDSTSMGNIVDAVTTAIGEVTTDECPCKTEIKEGTKLIITIDNV